MTDALDRFDQMLASAPQMVNHPGIAAPLALGGAPSTAIQATAGLLRGKSLVSQLTGMPDDQELKAWASLSKADQSLARANGYKELLLRDEEKSKKAWYEVAALGLVDFTWNKPIDAAQAALGAVDDVASAAVDYLDFATGEPLGALDAVTPDALVNPLVGAVDDTFEAVGEVGSDAVHLATDIYGQVTSRMDQAYRMAQMQDGGAVPLLGPTVGLTARGIVTGDIVRWWNEADRDNMPIDPREEAAMREQYGDVFELARQAQLDPEALLQRRADLITEGQSDPTKLDEAQALDQIMHSPEYAEVAQRLDAALLSPGRDVARILHVDDNEATQKIVSGTVDGLYRTATDPLLVAGKAVQGYRVAKYGLPVGDHASLSREIDKLFYTKGKASQDVRRYWDEAGRLFEKIRKNENPGDRSEALKVLHRDFREINPALRELMVKGDVFDADTAAQFMKDGESFKLLLSGQSAVRRPLMPYRTKMQDRVKKAKGKVIDFALDGRNLTAADESEGWLRPWVQRTMRGNLKSDLLEQAAVNADTLAADFTTDVFGNIVASGAAAETAKLLDLARRGWRGRVSTAHRRITTKLPDTNEFGSFDVMAPGASAQVERIASMFAPKYWAREVGATFAAMDEVGRKNVLKGIYATMAEGAGVTKTKAGQEWLKDAFRAMDDWAVGTYSVTKAGKLASAEDAAIFAADAAPYMPLPNFNEFYAQAAKIGFVDAGFNAVNRPMLDWYMQKVWRPSVLLRPALAFRNSIEETLNQLVREGSGPVLKGQAMMKTANRRQFELKKRLDREALDADLAAKQADEEFAATNGVSSEFAGEKIARLRADAEELRKERQSAGLKSAERYRETRRDARGIRKARADQLDAEAARLESALNGVNGLKDEADRKLARSASNPDAFDSEMGRLFRTVTAGPRALGRKLEAKAKQSNSPVLLEIADVLSNPNRGAYQFYRAHVYGKFSEKALEVFSPDSLRFVDELVENPYARSLFDKHIMEVAAGSARNQIDNVAKSSAGLVTSSSKWEPVQVYGEVGAESWAMRMDKIADDPAAAWILTHIDDEARAVEGAARIYANKAEYLRLRNVQEKGPDKFAAEMFHEVKGHVSSPDGTLIPQIQRSLYYTSADGSRRLNRAALSPNALKKIDNAERPEWIVGQNLKYLEIGATPMNTLVEKGFTWVGDMTAHMSRQRQFFSSYMQARQAMVPLENDLVAKLGGDGAAAAIVRKKMVEDALDVAIVKATGFVDNPRVRSQAAVLMRNFAPFYRAQEEFFTRWARTMKYNPESYGRAALTLHAATSSGFATRDENGDLFFVYPGSAVVHRVMADVGQQLGLDITKIPVASPITGKVTMLTAGFNPDQQLNPINGPIFAEPLRQLARMSSNPTLDQWEKKLLGPGADKGLLHANVPAILRPLYEEYALDSDRHELNVLAAMYANGQGLPPYATAEDKQKFLDRVRRHTNGMRAIRALLGPSLPAYPSMKPEQDPSAAAKQSGLASIRQEFYDLVKRVGDFGIAYQYWMKEHPDEVPFILGKNEVASGIPLSSTAEAGTFIENNRDFLQAFPSAAPFFIPQGEGDFNMRAYQLALDVGLREAIPLKDFLDKLMVGDGVGFYYKQREAFETRKQALKDSGQDTSGLEANWTAYRDEYLKLNPLVDEYLAEGGRRNHEREQTLAELRLMLDSGRAPAGPTADMYSVLVKSWDAYQVKRSSIEGQSEWARTQRRDLDSRFDTWMQGLVEGNPAGQLLYGKLFKYMN